VVESINNLSLCSGGGGLDIGLELALGAVRTVCWVEWEAFAIEYIAKAMENGGLDKAPIWTDVRTFDGRPWCGVVDSITAGYPCQPFSYAGDRHGQDDPRHLWPHVARIVGEIKPTLVFLENVSGHLTLGYDQVAADLDKLDYTVATGLFTTSEVGGSQKRERLFTVACAGRDHDNRRRQGCELGSRSEADTVGESSTNSVDHLCQDLDAGLPLFPPRPDDYETWTALLKDTQNQRLAPALEPDLHWLADGMAELRLHGNGVVPLQAAYAFCSLWSVLRNEVAT
jgi:DNA (cytosine-5)-methyltransferase 1